MGAQHRGATAVHRIVDLSFQVSVMLPGQARDRPGIIALGRGAVAGLAARRKNLPAQFDVITVTDAGVRAAVRTVRSDMADLQRGAMASL